MLAWPHLAGEHPVPLQPLWYPISLRHKGYVPPIPSGLLLPQLAGSRTTRGNMTLDPSGSFVGTLTGSPLNRGVATESVATASAMLPLTRSAHILGAQRGTSPHSHYVPVLHYVEVKPSSSTGCKPTHLLRLAWPSARACSFVAGEPLPGSLHPPGGYSQ